MATTEPMQAGAQPGGVTVRRVEELFELPFNELLYLAHTVHRENFAPNQVQRSRLANIKTGGCPEDCKYCSQSVRYRTDVERGRLMSVDEVRSDALAAKAQGATRYCMGAAWRGPKRRDMDQLCGMVREVKALGLETCMTLGLLDQRAAEQLAQAGLDYYNHNIDTSPEFYGEIITTRLFQDRLDTIQHVRDAGMKVCCGGILGMGETRRDRTSMLHVLANLDPPPESVPVNMLVPIEGTPLGGAEPVGALEFVRVIAVARILMPVSDLRLSAGRKSMSDEMQALCYFAGANSIFVGDRLLTTDNAEIASDDALFDQLGIEPMPSRARTAELQGATR